MRTLSLAAAFLGLFSGSLLMSGCMGPAYTKLKKDIDTPLFQAALHEAKPNEIFPLLAKEEISASNPEGRELILAILERRKADALRLIENGADLNATFINTPAGIYNTYTPLYLAVWDGAQDIVKALAAKGVDLNAETAGGWTAMLVASSADMVKLLLDHGYPVDRENKQGGTALSGFAVQGNTAVIRLLISRGADVEKARGVLEKGLRSFNEDPAVAAHLTKQIAQYTSAIQLLDRLNQPQTASQTTAAAGVTKAELAQMMKEAAAETRQAPAPVAAAPVAVVYKSDVDAPAYKASENPDAFALVVGVEKYNTLPDARFAERDAKAMNAHLLAMGYPQRNIVLLTGTQATRTGLVKNLEAWLPNNVTERSTVMFYFSGHGAPDAKTSQAYLVPMDGDPQYLEETAYPIKRLYAKLAALKAKRVLVALDSCFSGAGGRSVLATGTRPLVAKLEIAPAEGRVVSLSASSSDEITGALEEQGHGLFTYQLLKALTETAGRGTVSEVYAALKPRVQDEARRQNRAQTPQIFGRELDGGLR
jgi:hypothetical protein